MDDIESIRQLTAKYNRASDENQWDVWLDCFCVDAVFRRSNDTRAFHGHEELKLLQGRIATRARHITTDFEITVEGDEASQICYLMFLDRDLGFSVNFFGTYHDRLKRVDGNWKFAERLLVVDEP